jgi:hypothetical protein
VSLRDDGPDGVIGVGRLERQIEADELMVLLDDLEGLNPRADLLGDTIQFIVEHVAEPLSEDEREDEVFELGRLLLSADAARGVPDPRFQRRAAPVRYYFLTLNTMAH